MRPRISRPPISRIRAMDGASGPNARAGDSSQRRLSFSSFSSGFPELFLGAAATGAGVLGCLRGSAFGCGRGSAFGCGRGAAFGCGRGSAFGCRLGCGVGSRRGSTLGSRFGSPRGSALGSRFWESPGRAFGSRLGETFGSGCGSALGIARRSFSGGCPRVFRGPDSGRGAGLGSLRRESFGSPLVSGLV